ncbi:Hypothetical predicted protein [Lecanosticta acicola]|uniref:PEBP-like protein n=1 Tax=Lecanosticta acicola TaxID=111012 RepID=A0AAI9EDE0_9PEZI|nr:Hypothetical predicted protein [Lecanosticta acicola]
MKSTIVLLGLSVASVVAHPSNDQQPLSRPGDKFDLISQLKQAEIIPTVLDQFQPFLTVSVSWKKAKASIGNTIKPKRVQKTPHVSLVDELPDLSFAEAFRGLPQLTLALTDPDARSRDNPDWSEMCHWIATDIPLTSADQGLVASRPLKEIMPYKPPGPPSKTGKHRYVFAALSPRNGTHEPLNLTTPADRQHWGFGQPRKGLREWAEGNGLVVVGANFIYAQNKKQ